MIYTPEQLYDYCENNGLMLDLSTAEKNNDIGFKSLYAEGAIVLDKNGNPIFRIYMDEKKTAQNAIDTELTGNEPKEFIDRALAHPELLCCAMYRHGDEMYSLVACEKTPDESLEALNRSLYIAFLQCAKVNTIGKLKALLRRGDEIFEEWCRNNKECNIAY